MQASTAVDHTTTVQQASLSQSEKAKPSSVSSEHDLQSHPSWNISEESYVSCTVTAEEIEGADDSNNQEEGIGYLDPRSESEASGSSNIEGIELTISDPENHRPSDSEVSSGNNQSSSFCATDDD